MATDYFRKVGQSLSLLVNRTNGMRWEHETTGGGHDAFVFYPERGETDRYYLVTIDGEAEAPITESDWENIALGWYDDDDASMVDGFRMVGEVHNLATLVAYFTGGK